MMRGRRSPCSVQPVTWRVSRPVAATAGLFFLSILLSEIEIWVSDDVPGPRAGRALPLLLLLSVPILWRRHFPLAICLAIFVGLDAFSVWRGSPEGLELFVPLAVASFSVGAFCSRRRAMLGLCVLALGYAVYALEDIHVVQGGGTGEWAGGFFGVVILAFWLLGVFLHSRRESAELAGRALKLERDAAIAVSEERARMARELHDIVSHNLSVVVLQAAGARAAGNDTSALAKIEQSGREALVEMRRLLGVLREDDHGTDLAPQPGIGQLEQLAESVGTVGLSVEVSVGSGCEELPPAVELSVYRIVQEALTNVLKHAQASRAEVRVQREGDLLMVTVLDDGVHKAYEGETGGNGLIGMRERVALFGGDLRTGPQEGGGYAVLATMQLTE